LLWKRTKISQYYKFVNLVTVANISHNEFMQKKYILGIIIIVIVIIALFFAANYFAVLDKPLEVGEIRQVNNSANNDDVEDDDRILSVDYRVETVATNLFVPWSFVWTSPSRMLITERNGQVRVIENGELISEPIYIFDDVASSGEAGLLSVEIHPNYSENKFVYFSLTRQTESGNELQVIRLVDEGSTLSNPMTIISGIPAAQYHDGSALRFGPDGKLYLTTGDATDKSTPQDLNSLAGKTLRMNDDGSVPNDNPFEGSLVYSYGHRNSQGIDWHPVNGELYASEHGPSVFDGPAGGDEVNRIIAGKNYGWPIVSHEESLEGAKDPLIVFTPAEAPASMLVYSGKVFPQFTNNLFFGALRGEGLVRLVLGKNNPDKIIEVEKLADINYGRIRFVTEGPDGYIYFSTSNRDGRGKPQPGDDKIFRLTPLN
jgi:glucose/arabinose dehydrogenase